VDATDKLIATRLIWTGNFIAPWTSSSVCNGSEEAKMFRRLSTSIWVGGPRLFLRNKAKKLFDFSSRISGSVACGRTGQFWEFHQGFLVATCVELTYSLIA
jgi:hypothetical protein